MPHYEVLYLVASDYAHMNGRAVHNYLERDFGKNAAVASLAITTELLIRSLRMTNEKVDADFESEIDALHEEYVSAQPGGADRGDPGLR